MTCCERRVPPVTGDIRQDRKVLLTSSGNFDLVRALAVKHKEWFRLADAILCQSLGFCKIDPTVRQSTTVIWLSSSADRNFGLVSMS
jgi:hypothetical protein